MDSIRTRYVALDFETTGLEAALCEVIEYGAVQFDSLELGLELASLCAPHRPIPSQASLVNGITDAMVAGYPPFEQHLDLLLDFIGDRIVVCHNAPFDMSFLNRYCRLHGKQAPVQVMDTLQLARRCLRHLPSHSLKSVAAFLKIPQHNAHRALDDARVTAQVMIELLELMA